MRGPPRVEYDLGLRALQDRLVSLGGLAKKALDRAVAGFKDRDLDLLRAVVAEDDLIDRERYAIEDRCIDLIATQQPTATDLRVLVTILHVSVELERIGDHAEGIAKIGIRMGGEPPLKPLIDIPRMADKASEMLQGSLDAFVNRDVERARLVSQADDEVDQLYRQIYHELFVYMLQDTKAIERATYLLWAAHDIERIADRATNIAERVVYVVTGRTPDK